MLTSGNLAPLFRVVALCALIALPANGAVRSVRAHRAMAPAPPPGPLKDVIALATGAGAHIQVAPGSKVSVPVIIDMAAANGAAIASVAFSVQWDVARLTFDSVRAAGTGVLTPNLGGAPTGTVALTLSGIGGAVSSFTAATMYFTAATSGGTAVAFVPSAATSAAATNLLPLVRARNTDVCVAPPGTWGDANGDLAVNIIDAQQIARFTVSLGVLDAAALAALGDVNADAAVDIIDAQQIARFSVALSASPRVGTAVFTPPVVTTLTAPSVSDAVAGAVTVGMPAAVGSLLTGYQAQIQPLAKDAANANVTACASLTYVSNNTAAATVSPTGLVIAVAPGSATITVSAGGVSALVNVTVVDAVPALQLIASGLSSPVFVTSPVGDLQRIFIVEQSGAIKVSRQDQVLATPFLDLSAVISFGGERGLLGLAFHPQFATNGFFYVSYTDVAGNSQVVRYHATAGSDVADAASAAPILSQAQPFANHNGGMIVFGPDAYLYIGLGDGGGNGDPQGNGQLPSTWLGKILRIDVDAGAPYAVPATNPFVSANGVKPEIWALGVRNPWRFSFDRATGDLYIGEVGQAQFEEVDFEPAASGGRNYGWSVVEGNSCFVVATCVADGLTAGLTPPVLTYTHADGCSVTGGYVYRGPDVPALSGHYFYSDYCFGWVRSFRMSGGVATQLRDWPQLAPGGFISSHGEDARGSMYVVRHSPGAVYRIVGVAP